MANSADPDQLASVCLSVCSQLVKLFSKITTSFHQFWFFLQPLDHQVDVHPTEPPRPAYRKMLNGKGHYFQVRRRKMFLPYLSLPNRGFRRGLACNKAGRKSQKLSPLYKMAENIPRISSPLKFPCQSAYPNTVSPAISRCPMCVRQKNCWSLVPRSLILATHTSANTCCKKDWNSLIHCPHIYFCWKILLWEIKSELNCVLL